jgi:hypothetical protein
MLFCVCVGRGRNDTARRAFSRVHTGASHLRQLMWVRAGSVLYQVLYCTCPELRAWFASCSFPARKTTFSSAREKKDTLAHTSRSLPRLCVCERAPGEWKRDREQTIDIFIYCFVSAVIRKYSGVRIRKQNRFGSALEIGIRFQIISHLWDRRGFTRLLFLAVM